MRPYAELVTVGGDWRELRRPSRPRESDMPAPFTRLARTHALAMAGDTVVTIALAGSLFFSISPTAARGRVMLSLIFTMAPFAVVAPFLGPAIARARAGRRLMVVATAIGRAVACAAMARVVDGLLLFPAAFAVLVLSKAYAVTKSAIVPGVVPDRRALVEANSKLSIVGVVAGFVAAVPGVILLKVGGAEWALGFAVLLFLATAVSGFGLRTPQELVSVTSVDEGHEGDGKQAGPGPGLALTAAAVATALLRAVVGFLTFLVAFGFRREGAPSWWFGVVLAASMASGLAGAAVAPPLRARVREESILVGSLALAAAGGLVAGRLEGALWAAAVAGAVGVAAAAGKLAFDAIVQRDAHDDVRGRVFARFEAGFQLVWVVGALLPVVVATPLRQGYDVLGIACLAGGVAYATAFRKLGRVET